MTPMSLLAGRAVVTVIVINTRFVVYKTIYLGFIVMFLIKECTAPTILRRLFLFFIFCVRIKSRNSAKIIGYNVPGMI